MFRFIEGDTRDLADVHEFIKLVDKPPIELRDFFDCDYDIFIARAPGRLDVMGGIADYSGSLVLELPIAEATLAAVQKTDDTRIRIASLQPGSAESLKFEMDLSDIPDLAESDYYADAQGFFTRDPSNQWAGYVAGAFVVLQRELGIDFDRGARILIFSHVPIGSGVSSSAALEVATMHALCAVYGIKIGGRKLAMLCQMVENLVVGAPCGVMDQIAASCCNAHSLISIRCQPAEIQGHIDIPNEIEFWGIDSGVRHSVAGTDYASVRAGAFMGYRIIAEFAGLETRRVEEGFVEIDDSLWLGYLANLTPPDYEKRFASLLPEKIFGREFIDRFDGTTDRLTKIDPDATYSVRSPTEFPIYENDRVLKFSRIMEAKDVTNHLSVLGALMFDSHAGYAACGLSEPGTDRLVDLVKEHRESGLYGARITGGGSGGTVAIAGKRGCRPAVDEIAEKYQKETGRAPYVFDGSSPGCAEFGSLVLRSSNQDRASRHHNLPSGGV